MQRVPFAGREPSVSPRKVNTVADDPLDLFDDAAESDALDVYGQDGPDLFGTEPGELILPTEPVAPDDPDVDVEMDTMDEIPIEEPDADDDAAVEPAVPTPAPTAGPDEPDRRRPEAPLALYRRYRPDTFADVVGQEHVTEPLQRALANNRVNHAYLFSGPRGCGKTSSARILARCLNCAQGPTPTPCGVCRSCRDLARGGAGSIDVIEIDAASHGGVDEARDLRERAFFAPVSSRYKIYIIDEAHMVTPQGFNALLKVVEEPPPHVKFVFATTEPEKVIGTIRSRTHHYPFRLLPPRTLSAYLGKVCEAEGVRVEESVLPLVVRAGAGSVRDSLSVLDQLLGGAGESGVTYAQAAALLGYTPDSLLDAVMDAFAAGDAEGVFAVIDKVVEAGQDPRRFAEDLLRRLRDLIIVAAVPDALATGLVDVAGDQAERLRTQAAGLGPGELTRAAEVIAKGQTDMRGTTAPRLHLELMCARVLLPGADVDARGVHARLDRLERRLNMATAGAAAVDPVRNPAAEPGASGTRASEPRAPAPRTSDPEPAPTRTTVPDPEPSSGSEPVPEPRAREPESRRSVAPGEPQARGPQPAASDPGTMTTADIRASWPEVLDAVRRRRRVTWIVLRENAQVHAFADDTLTLSLDNPGARDSLARGGSVDIVREAFLEVLGIAPRIETVAAQGQSAPASEAAPSRRAPGEPSQAREVSSGADVARANLRDAPTGAPEPEPEQTESRDDPDMDGDGLNSDELLTTYLGAELIGEEGPPG